MQAWKEMWRHPGRTGRERFTVITAESGISATASEAVATLVSECAAASEASAFLASERDAGALHGTKLSA